MAAHAMRHPHIPLSRTHTHAYSFFAPANPVEWPLILRQHTPPFMLTHASRKPEHIRATGNSCISTPPSQSHLASDQMPGTPFPLASSRSRCNIWSVGSEAQCHVRVKTPPRVSSEFIHIGSSAHFTLQHGLWPVSPPDGPHCVNEQRWSIEDIRSMSVILYRGPLAAIETQPTGCPSLICLC